MERSLVVGLVSGGIQRIGMARYNADGTPDLSFGTGGQVVTEFDLFQSAISVVTDSLGRILVAGSDGLARYHSNGALDGSFGIGGLINTFTFLNKVALDANGKIVVSGGNRLARFLPDGTVDASFNSTGQVNTGTLSVAEFVIDGTGNLVVVGSLHNGMNSDIAVRRYTPLGQLDTSYGSGGTTLFDFGGPNGDNGSAITLFNSGVAVAGEARGTFTNGVGWDFFDQVLIHLDNNGTPVAGFGTTGNGISRYRAPTQLFQESPAVIKIDSANRPVIGSIRAVARYTTAGLLDTSFDGDGIAFFPGGLSNITAINFDASGKILAGGSRSNGSFGSDFAVARLNSNNGSLDTTFGVGGVDGNGVVSTNFMGSTSDGARDLVQLLPDGKILAAGFASGGTSDIVLARFLPNGAIDTTFAVGDSDGHNGFAITDFGGFESAESLTVDSSGRIYVSYSNVVVRYTSNGLLDTSYGSSGRAFTSLNTVTDLAATSDGKILASGAPFPNSSRGEHWQLGFRHHAAPLNRKHRHGVRLIGSCQYGYGHHRRTSL